MLGVGRKEGGDSGFEPISLRFGLSFEEAESPQRPASQISSSTMSEVASPIASVSNSDSPSRCPSRADLSLSLFLPGLSSSRSLRSVLVLSLLSSEEAHSYSLSYAQSSIPSPSLALLNFSKLQDETLTTRTKPSCKLVRIPSLPPPPPLLPSLPRAHPPSPFLICAVESREKDYNELHDQIQVRLSFLSLYLLVSKGVTRTKKEENESSSSHLLPPLSFVLLVFWVCFRVYRPQQIFSPTSPPSYQPSKPTSHPSQGRSRTCKREARLSNEGEEVVGFVPLSLTPIPCIHPYSSSTDSLKTSLFPLPSDHRKTAPFPRRIHHLPSLPRHPHHGLARLRRLDACYRRTREDPFGCGEEEGESESCGGCGTDWRRVEDYSEFSFISLSLFPFLSPFVQLARHQLTRFLPLCSVYFTT